MGWRRAVALACFVVSAFAAGASLAASAQDDALAHIENLRAQGKVAEALAAYDAAIVAAETAGDRARVSKLAHDAAIFAMLLERYDDAEKRARKALAVETAVSGAKSGNVAAILNTLAQILESQGRYADAVGEATKAVAIAREAFGAAHPNVGATLSTLGKLHAATGDVAAAEKTLLEAIKIEEKGLGGDHPAVAGSLNDLAALYRQQLRLDEAEVLQKRVVAIAQKVYGPNHPNHATALSALGRNYLDQARWDDAETVLARALDIRRKVLGDKHNDTADTWNDLAWADMGRGDPKAAAGKFLRSLEVREAASTQDPEAVAKGLSSLARAMRDVAETSVGDRVARYADAEKQSVRAVNVAEKAGLAKRPWMASVLTGLGVSVLAQGRAAEAQALADRALALAPEANVTRASALRLRAAAQLQQTKVAPALADARAAAAIYTERRTQAGLASIRGEAAQGINDRDAYYVAVRAAYAQSANAGDVAARDEGFAFAQRAGGGATARAVWRMAARFAAKDDTRAKLLREQQVLTLRLPEVEAQYVELLSSSDAARQKRAEARRKESARIRDRLKALDGQLRKDFAPYAELADPQPVTIADLQALLKPDEAALQYVVADYDGYVIAVSKEAVTFEKLRIAGSGLRDDVSTLRRQLDPSMWNVLPPNISALDRALAYRLYQQLWRPVESVVAGKAKVFVVADGPLTSLPLTVLVTAPPVGGAEGDRNPQVLRDTPWLLKKHALITLPSLSSLKALRRYAATSGANEPFSGFGDPALGAPDDLRGASRRPVAAFFRGGSPERERLEELGSLPRTAIELKALAAASGGDAAKDLWLGSRATETAVKRAPLSHKRVVAFSTHGLMAGEIGQGEPGLVMTLPEMPSPTDDGFLAASEIADLKLNAEWVVLSACNTAAGDKPGAAGLSGLSRAFFLAGAKSMLVSHWSVWDDASAALTTGTLARLKAKQAPDRAAALQQAQLALMADKKQPRFAHPAAWAPFVLVGESTEK
ncbi:MAG: CHAT domain-containing tetratricopeptide repeat protein [Alphaproteobacteria bacterium]|nr:CHAT domain-containing tetratricopeptide repeat protein [Alphaproteobacteria bacterium]